MDVGGPNPRGLAAVLSLGVMAWALWTVRRRGDLWLAAALGAFLVHAYAVCSVQVHENHMLAAVPLLVVPYPLLWLVRMWPSLPVLIGVQSAFCVLAASFVGVAPAALADAFPTRVRSIGVSLLKR